MESQFRLERTSAARALSFAAMRDACIVKGEDPWADRAQIAYSDPFAYVTMLLDWAEGKSLPPGWVSNDTFWVVEDDEVVAECDVRFPLTPALRNVGGHIGYLVHPGHRGKGVATFALQESLKVLVSRGESDALLTCAATNIASIRVIEKCGGQQLDDSASGRRRYTIPLTAPGFVFEARNSGTRIAPGPKL